MAGSTDADREVANLAHLIEGHHNHVAQQIDPEVAVEPDSMGAREQANTETGPGGGVGRHPTANRLRARADRGLEETIHRSP